MGMSDDRAHYWSKATLDVLRLFAGTVSVPSVLGTAWYGLVRLGTAW